MRDVARRCIAIASVCAAACHGQNGFAETASDAIDSASLVRVQPSDADWVIGWLVGADHDSLRILAENDATRSTFAVNDIERLQRHDGTKLQTKRGALVGGIVLGGLGLALGATLAEDDFFNVQTSEVLMLTFLSAAAGAAAGALIGTLFRTDRWVDTAPPWDGLAPSDSVAAAMTAGDRTSLTGDARAAWSIGVDASFVLPRRIDTGWGCGVFARRRILGTEVVLEPRIDAWFAQDDDTSGDGYVEIRDVALRMRASYFLPWSDPRIVFVGTGIGFHQTRSEIDRDWGDGYQAVEDHGQFGVDAGAGVRTFLPAGLRLHLEGWSTFAGDVASNIAFSAGLSYSFGARSR